MKKVSFFFYHECHKCGACDEAKFYFAGPHLKQVCNNCGFYVKFFNKALIPDVKEIKQKIWFMTDGVIEIINSAKTEVEFIDGLKGLDEKMMYWKLYLNIRKKVAII